MKTNTLLLLAAIAALPACSGSTMTAPLTPNPVLLGPVDRIGGALAPKGERVLGDVNSISNDGMARTYSAALAAAVVDKTEGRDDRTMRVSDVQAEANFFLVVLGVYIHMHSTRAVTIKGSVTESTEVAHASR